MRLEPVYLIAPEPEPKKVSRRTLFTAVAASAIVGSTGGWWFSRRRPAEPDAEGDATLRWALDRVADEQPDRLLDGYEAILVAVMTHAEEHPELWHGFERIVIANLAGTEFGVETQDQLAKQLLQILESLPHPERLDRYREPLRQLGR